MSYERRTVNVYPEPNPFGICMGGGFSPTISQDASGRHYWPAGKVEEDKANGQSPPAPGDVAKDIAQVFFYGPWSMMDNGVLDKKEREQLALILDTLQDGDSGSELTQLLGTLSTDTEARIALCNVLSCCQQAEDYLRSGKPDLARKKADEAMRGAWPAALAVMGAYYAKGTMAYHRSGGAVLPVGTIVPR